MPMIVFKYLHSLALAYLVDDFCQKTIERTELRSATQMVETTHLAIPRPTSTTTFGDKFSLAGSTFETDSWLFFAFQHCLLLRSQSN
jgi:hypothetical protein